MTSVAVGGWLMECEQHAAGDDAFGTAKRATTVFYLDQIVAEALGLRAAATVDVNILYVLPANAFAA